MTDRQTDKSNPSVPYDTFAGLINFLSQCYVNFKMNAFNMMFFLEHVKG